MCHPQIGECEQRYDLPCVLLESAITNLSETEWLLDDAEGILNDGTDDRKNPIGFLLLLSEFTPLGFLALGKNPVSARLNCFIDFICSAMTMALFSQIAHCLGA